MIGVKIGKFIIENLTSGMYEDSKIIYREYIQNAADQIDFAEKNSLFKDDQLMIDIHIDPVKRNITITDNATGIPREKVVSDLADIADSDKVQGEAKGFRGIGRLGGLAYCDTLQFVTSAKGEMVKTIMTYNAKQLHEMIHDPTIKEDAGTIFSRIISIEEEDCNIDEHFFRVEMLGVRKENHDLLEVEDIKKYISLNTPVPFKSNFIYKEEIKRYCEKNEYSLDEYKIYVNGEDIHKLYTTTLVEKHGNGTKSYDEIYGLEFKKFCSDNGEILAWMWYGISCFEKQIPFPLNEFAGIRIRQHNIQVGNEATLIPLFKEQRGNLYFIGEIHVVHRELRPNSRRDYFNENVYRNELEVKLKDCFHEELHRLYSIANQVKSVFKREERLIQVEKEYRKKEGRFINNKEEEKAKDNIAKAEKEKKDYDKKLENLKKKVQPGDVFDNVIKRVESKYKKSISESITEMSQSTGNNIKKSDKVKESNKGYLVEELTRYSKKQQKLISRIYAVIKDNLPPNQSEELICKIQEELKNGKKNTSS